jgi:hypothetical protein
MDATLTASTPDTQQLIDQQRAYSASGRMLDDDEGSNWDPPIPTARETEWRHGKWQDKRTKMRAAIVTATGNAKRLERWDSCGACAVVEYSKELDKTRVTCWHCRDRMCEPCQAKRTRELARIVRTNVQGGQARFITISLKHRDVPLKDQIRRLRNCFNRFKRTKFWKAHVYGGVAILEVKREKKGWRERADGTKYQTSGLWHPHLHMITTGTWMDQREASRKWLKITGDSDRFDIRVVDREESAAHYVSKYVTKSCNAEVVNNPEWLAELVDAMHRSRTYNVFGSWVGVNRDEELDTATDWKPITTVHDLLAARDRGEEWARGMCRRLFREPTEPKDAKNAPKSRETG